MARRWTKEEEQTLLELWGNSEEGVEETTILKEIAATMDRSVRSIASKLRAMSLREAENAGYKPKVPPEERKAVLIESIEEKLGFKFYSPESINRTDLLNIWRAIK